ERASLEGSAKVASVDVKDENLAAHLQSPDFFDAERYPELRFSADEISLDGDGNVSVGGELTIKGVTKPVTVTGTVTAPIADAWGNDRIGLNLTATVDRTNFGLSWNNPLAMNALRNKPVAVVGASTGGFGAIWAQAELRKVLAALGARVLDVELPVPHAHTRFDEGDLTDDEIRTALTEVLETLAEEVREREEAKAVA